MLYSIEKITTLIGARRYGSADGSIRWILTDSRSVCFPEDTLFFAIRSERNDGHKYVADLYRRGVRNFVVEELPADRETAYADANFLKVPHSVEALQRLAERHRDEFDIPIVGITGSNGKTVVKEWLYQLLSPQMIATRSPRSYNSQIGVPLSVWLLDEHSQVGIFEAGISQKGEMQALRDIIQPTVGVLTNLGSAHQENFSSMEEKCLEKLKLFHDTKAIVYPLDDETVRSCVAKYDYKGEQIAWSMKDQDAKMYVNNVEKSGISTTVSYVFDGKEGRYTLPFIDEASVENSVTCAAIALHLGLDVEQIAERMPAIEPVAMRLEVKEGQHGCTLINDSYNSDVNSLDIALDFMSRRPDHAGRKRTLILSDIYQSGKAGEALYKEVSDLAKTRGVQKIIGIGPEISANADVIDIPEKHFFADCHEFIASPEFGCLHDEVILLKGARKFSFDRLTELLEQKVHETILEVNLNAVVKNLNHFRSYMKPATISPNHFSTRFYWKAGEYKIEGETLTVGICYGTSPHPQITDEVSDYRVVLPIGEEKEEGSAEFSIDDLKPATTYYARPFTIIDGNPVYFQEFSVETVGNRIQAELKKEGFLKMKISYKINQPGTYHIRLQHFSTYYGGVYHEDFGYKKQGDSDSFSYNCIYSMGSAHNFCLHLTDIETGIIYQSNRISYMD